MAECVSGAALLHPDRTFGEPEMLAQSFEFRAGRDNFVEGRVQADHPKRARSGLGLQEATPNGEASQTKVS